MAGNANSGRRPFRTALHVLRGTSGRGRQPARGQLPTGPIVKPAGLSGAASAVWDEVAPICQALQTLTPADVRAFATYCELQGSFDQAQQQKAAADFALVHEDKRAHKPVLHAVLRFERDLAAALRPYYEMFGLVPSARSRLVLPPPPAPPSKWGSI
jgi:P27 family predicted phage terminase small subunit